MQVLAQAGGGEAAPDAEDEAAGDHQRLEGDRAARVSGKSRRRLRAELVAGGVRDGGADVGRTRRGQLRERAESTTPKTRQADTAAGVATEEAYGTGLCRPLTAQQAEQVAGGARDGEGAQSSRRKRRWQADTAAGVADRGS